MENSTLNLPWGQEEISLKLPAQWRLLGRMAPSALAFSHCGSTYPILPARTPLHGAPINQGR